MSARTLTLAALAGLSVAALVLAAAGRAHRLGLVPVRDVLAALRSALPGRLAVALVWAWLGWHLLAR